MRFLAAALALLVLGVANAHHTPSHRLKYPEFVLHKTHVYDLTINTTSGVPGLHSQVSKTTLHMEVEMYAKTQTDLIIRAHRVMVSHALPGVASDTAEVVLRKNSELENKMKIPIKAVYKDGMIKSYTLDPRETVESAKIKRTILRNLEIYFDEVALTVGPESWAPITYNRTQSTPVGNYTSHYVVTSSPYPAFPEMKDVYNITRSDNYEVIPYLAYRSHHNYEQQGCPEVCKKNHIENPFSAGCPVGEEPYNTPIKKAYFQKHNIRKVSSGETILDMVETKETHIADLYDQNLKVLLMSLLRFKRTTTKSITESTNQKEYTDLNDMSAEINEPEISERCGYPDPREAIQAAKSILEEIATTVIAGNIEEPKSKLLGEHIVLLQKALQILKQGDFRTIEESIVKYDELSSATEMQKVKRQVWLDILPVIGTSESVSYIVHLIRENVNKPNKAISLWESKSILEALPMNILEPTERTISELSRLLDIITDVNAPGYKMFYSASYLAVARVIRNMCTITKGFYEEEGMESAPARNNLRREFLLRRQQNSEEYIQRRCPKTVVKKFVSDVTEKLKSTHDKTKRMIYIQTLARTGILEVLKVLKPYAYGHISDLTHSYIDFVRTVTLHALYHVAAIHPRPVQDIVVPIFFNKTESPKVRTAAFGVIVKSQPTLGLFQHIAEESWNEPSEEVASFVTSTLETFGNSTIPCQQLTARRIKKVLPQIKRHVRGCHRSKNNLWSFFDSIRGFGMESRLEFTSSNESFIPSVLYWALGANVDSFRDLFYQYAVNSQGFTSRNVWDSFVRVLGLTVAENIPKETEKDIFPDIEILSRDPEFWRFTIYRKLFYSSSYYYYDGEEVSRESVFQVLKEQYSHYMKWTSHGDMEGHIVRLYIPSSYHTKAIAHAMPSPVEFEMRNPLLLSLKLKMQLSASGKGMKYALDLKPSVYYTSLYTNQFLNLGDCKDIGVYYEKRFAATYPVQVALNLNKDEKLSVSYTFPHLPKTIFTYHSEAGTYAGKKKLVALPPMEDRRTYRTIPTLFKKKYNFGFFGLPPFESEVHTEDIQSGYEEVPRNGKEIAHNIIKQFFNAGWRRKSIVVKRVPDNKLWTPRTEMKLYLNYGRDHVIPTEKNNEDWKKGLKFEDDLKEKNVTGYAKEGKIIRERFPMLPHIHDKLSIRVEQVISGKPAVTGSLNVTHQYTYGGFLHLFHVNASCYVERIRRDIGLSASYALAFTNRPNDFYYKESSYGKQIGLAVGSISFPHVCAFEKPLVSSKALFHYKPLESIFKHETEPPVTSAQLKPETHEECLKHLSSGRALDVPCTKAMREMAIYNHMRLHFIWDKPLPHIVLAIGDKLDLALKHAFYTHLTSHKKMLSHSLYIDSTYIDKLTDMPVIDMVITKPTEQIKFHKVSASTILPLSSISSIYDMYAQKYTNNSYPATCALMDQYIMTYDLKTMKLPREDVPACTYILSTHCTEQKKFAVFVKIDPSTPGTKEVHVYVGKHHVVLVPGSRSGYSVKYDDREYTIRHLHPFMFNEEEEMYALVYNTVEGPSVVEFHAKRAGIKVAYNGKNVKMQVHPRYKGELCGMCSEFNGESEREMRGVDKCLYSDSSDFLRSSMVGSCAKREPTRPRLCNDEEITFSRNDDSEVEEEAQEPTMKRNIVLTREDKLCFSIRPIPVCEDSTSMTEAMQLKFHCLPKEDRNARKLVIESKRRILGELETKSVDMTEYVEVATAC